jgi:Fe-S-cluster containining protein
MASAKLARLIAEIESNPHIASGEQRFRRRLRRDESADIADFAHQQIDVAASSRDQAAEAQGLVVACGQGCAFCCEELIMVAAPEVATVARWLERAPGHSARAHFLSTYDDWRAQVGDVPERLAEFTARGKLEQHEDLYLEQYHKRLACPFLDAGLCTIYPVRPVGCRHAHAIDTADYCRVDNPMGRIPKRFPHAEFDQAISRGHALMRAAHHSSGAPRGRPKALAVAVYERLTGTKPTTTKPKAVGRNAPCPCGSGKKHKRCCG